MHEEISFYMNIPFSSTLFLQFQLATKFGLKRQNVHHCIKELGQYGYILLDRIEGRNKFIKVNTSVLAICNANEFDDNISE